MVNGCRSAEANSVWTACRRTQLSQNVGAATVMVVVVCGMAVNCGVDVCWNGDGGCGGDDAGDDAGDGGHDDSTCIMIIINDDDCSCDDDDGCSCDEDDGYDAV